MYGKEKIFLIDKNRRTRKSVDGNPEKFDKSSPAINQVFDKLKKGVIKIRSY